MGEQRQSSEQAAQWEKEALEAFRDGELEAAAAKFEKAGFLYQVVGDGVGEGRCLHRLGSVAMAREDFEAAFVQFEQAKALREQGGDWRGVADTLHQLGTLHLHKQEYEAARSYSRGALRIQHEIGYREGVASSLYQLAASYMEEGDHREAVTGFRHALKLMASQRDVRGVASVLSQLGMLAYKEGRVDGAFKLMAVCASMEGSINHPDAQQSLKEAHWLAGKAGYTDEAFQPALQQAVELFFEDEGAALIQEIFPEE